MDEADGGGRAGGDAAAALALTDRLTWNPGDVEVATPPGSKGRDAGGEPTAFAPPAAFAVPISLADWPVVGE